MIPPSKIFGRLGNQMFQYAFLYAYSKDAEVDFYFQNPAWFNGYESDIRSLFGQGIPETIDMVSIHVRRGDYINNSFYVNLCQTDYYDRAIALFPHDKFLIFSDDIEWCKAHFTGKQFEFSEGKTEVEDMNLMAACKHNIIANSSFSWWAAWLNFNLDKKVIVPLDWYSDGEERTYCPPKWQRI